MFWVFRDVFGTPRRCFEPQNKFRIRSWLTMESGIFNVISTRDFTSILGSCGDENATFRCESWPNTKCILGLKTPSRGSKNNSKYLKHHLRPPRSSLKKSWKITLFVHSPEILHYRGTDGQHKPFGSSYWSQSAILVRGSE